MYLKNGQECEVVAEFVGGYVVTPIFDRDGQTVEGDQRIAKEVFESPPTERLNKDVVEMQSKKRDLAKLLDELRTEIREATADRQKLLDSIKQLPALQRIDDFINRRFTHVVKESYGSYVIVAIGSKEFYCDSSGRSYDREYKLITLMGRTNGDLSFQLNQYSDGSGSGSECWLCLSEQEAKDLVVEKINARLKGMSDSSYHLDRYAKSLNSIGVAVPEVIATKIEAERILAATAAKEKAQKELDKANADFERIVGKKE